MRRQQLSPKNRRSRRNRIQMDAACRNASAFVQADFILFCKTKCTDLHFSKNSKKSCPKCKKALDFCKLKCYNILGFRSQGRKFIYVRVCAVGSLREKTIAFRFFDAKSPKQGALGASASSTARRLCDGVFSPAGRADDFRKALALHFSFIDCIWVWRSW